MKLRATDAAFWALLTGLAVGMAWNPVAAWAQAKEQGTTPVAASATAQGEAV